jgi:hypothetical protein
MLTTSRSLANPEEDFETSWVSVTNGANRKYLLGSGPRLKMRRGICCLVSKAKPSMRPAGRLTACANTTYWYVVTHRWSE